MNFSPAELEHFTRVARKFPDLDTDQIVDVVIKVRIAGIEKIEPKSVLLRNEILLTCCKYHDQPVEVIKSGMRFREFVRIRQQYSLIASLLKYSLHAIGEEINRDHATVLHSIRKAILFCNQEPDYMNEMRDIISTFKGNEILLSGRLANILN